MATANSTKTLAGQRRAAVERAFPGVICKRVAFECAHRPAGDDSPYFREWADGKLYSLNLTVEASAETLVSHGLIEQREIDSLPPSGRRSGLEKTNRGTYQASVHYFDYFDTPTTTVAREMAAKIGISDPRHRVYSGGKWRVVEVEPGTVEPESNVMQRRSRCIGRLQRLVKWATLDKLIVVDWNAVRAARARS